MQAIFAHPGSSPGCVFFEFMEIYLDVRVIFIIFAR